MRKIKILGLVVVFVLPLLFFSTIRSEGQPTLAVVIIQCAGNPLAVTQVDIFPLSGIYTFCDDASGFSCEKGDSCAECLAACIEETETAGGIGEVGGVAVSGSSNKTTVTYTLLEDHHNGI